MMEALLERVDAEVETEPRLPAIGGTPLCGVCGRRLASPLLKCSGERCGKLLCTECAHMRRVEGVKRVFCPTHKKGAA